MANQTNRSDDFLLVGKIVKAHGIKGELKILSYSGVAEDLLPYKKIYLHHDAHQDSYKVSKSRVQGKFSILKLSSINTREDSENLIGYEVSVEKSDIPKLPADEFYWHEYKGLRVVTEQGEELGVVKNLMATGANDVLVIAGKGQEYLVPVIADVIVECNRDLKTLVIAPLPGLLEINDPDAD